MAARGIYPKLGGRSSGHEYTFSGYPSQELLISFVYSKSMWLEILYSLGYP